MTGFSFCWNPGLPGCALSVRPEGLGVELSASLGPPSRPCRALRPLHWTCLCCRCCLKPRPICPLLAVRLVISPGRCCVLGVSTHTWDQAPGKEHVAPVSCPLPCSAKKPVHLTDAGGAPPLHQAHISGPGSLELPPAGTPLHPLG